MTLRRSQRIASRPRRSKRIAALLYLSLKKRDALLASERPTKKRRITTSVGSSSKYMIKKVNIASKKHSKKIAATAASTTRRGRKTSMKKNVTTGQLKKMTTPAITTPAIVTPTKKPLGVIDSESNIANGTIEVLDNDPCDVMLALVDPSKNMDKFFIIQLIRRPSHSGCHHEFIFYTRFGRTGTTGQIMQEVFTSRDDAVTTFREKFHQKTGLEWNRRNDSPVKDRYHFLKQDFEQKRDGFRSVKWQYWVDDGVDGKHVGWYDYTKEGSSQVERLFHEHNLNGSRLTNRLVESGHFTYNVDLSRMTQTNVSHPNRTSRRIRRC